MGSEIMKEINKAFKSQLKKTKIEINNIKFDIIFERMFQRNSKTFWERRIRVVTGEYEFEEKRGSWRKYDQTVQRLIYAGMELNVDKVLFTFQKVNYTIDLKTLVETNEKKKSKRKIRACGNDEHNIIRIKKEEEEETEEGDENEVEDLKKIN